MKVQLMKKFEKMKKLIEAQLMKKLSNTEAELKRKKKGVTIFGKCSILDVWLGLEYVSSNGLVLQAFMNAFVPRLSWKLKINEKNKKNSNSRQKYSKSKQERSSKNRMPFTFVLS